MDFGIFMAPFHPVGQNPTLALERDLELIQHLDRLGFDEAWVGEHHSAGYEIIASPEVFIGIAAERTKHIRLGTGVSSLPYHHPLMLADRMVLLDHLTRGRTMLGCRTGPAHLGRAHARHSVRRAAAADGGVTRRDHGAPARRDGHDGDRRVRHARRVPAARPYSDPCFDIAVAASFSPDRCRAAGKHGIGMLSIAATAKQGMDLLGHHWNLWEEIASQNGHVADRSKWRLVGPMHLAETREQAEKEVEYGIEQFSRYFTHVLPAGPVQGENAKEIIENNKATGFAVIGTPDDAIAKIEELIESSNGGFGTFLLFGHDWATPAATIRSAELFAQYVMPKFKGQLDAPASSCEWVTGQRRRVRRPRRERDRQGDRGPRGRARE